MGVVEVSGGVVRMVLVHAIVVVVDAGLVVQVRTRVCMLHVICVLHVVCVVRVGKFMVHVVCMVPIGKFMVHVVLVQVGVHGVGNVVVVRNMVHSMLLRSAFRVRVLDGRRCFRDRRNVVGA